jgi:hypothetical protein
LYELELLEWRYRHDCAEARVRPFAGTIEHAQHVAHTTVNAAQHRQGSTTATGRPDFRHITDLISNQWGRMGMQAV